MKFEIIALVFMVCITGLSLLLNQAFIQTKNFTNSTCYEGSVVPVFSPYDSEEIFDLIRNAKNEIKVEIYEFSYKDLVNALISAREHGVSIKVILEPSVYNNNNMFNYFIKSGISVSWATKKFHNTHSKFMVIDGSIVFVGSMNWSENSMKNNREASVIIYSKEISSSFERIFDEDFSS
jgi:phosphatidylserine/phosphatidylglycerophosphate/cardiolipin synthase-like enzyme